MRVSRWCGRTVALITIKGRQGTGLRRPPVFFQPRKLPDRRSRKASPRHLQEADEGIGAVDLVGGPQTPSLAKEEQGCVRVQTSLG